MRNEKQIRTLKEKLKRTFEEIIGVKADLTEAYENELCKLLEQIEGDIELNEKKQEEFFIKIINRKYRWNETSIRKIFYQASRQGIIFNFKQKIHVEDWINRGDIGGLKDYLASLNISSNVIECITLDVAPIKKSTTVSNLHEEIKAPSRLRIDGEDRNIDIHIIESIFSAYLWAITPTEKMHSFFCTNSTPNRYIENYWDFLKERFPQKFTRNNALNIINVNKSLFLGLKNSYPKLRSTVLNLIAKSFQEINNHGFLSIIIENLEADNCQYEWQLVADCVLYAEKHVTEKCTNSYFRHETIRDKTRSYIPNLKVEDCNFEFANSGFTYRDTFVISDKSSLQEKLVLILQANRKDEIVLPCPTCRSSNVRGNSYSSLGVRSWECSNLLCLDRSKYNRGKRYSFRSLLMQEASDKEAHVIRQEQVRRWSKDVVAAASENEIISMLLNFYTLNGDTARIYNLDVKETNINGRLIQRFNLELDLNDIPFFNSYFFKRYVTDNISEKLQKFENIGDSNLIVYNGDSAQVLSTICENTIDGAVTSPPYYNSREYSQWDNIYCYLYDMYKINKQVFRVLKPGALYFYNIFDTFGNENSLALSAMGQKRMILSAYTADLFRRIGFVLRGNVVWDKGEIQGKRAFNNGNYSPFYQSPFNCWEHIWVFQKPTKAKSNSCKLAHGFRKTLKENPVLKMVKGVNTHGHSAPFPKAIPKLLIDTLLEDSVILDPFAGSLTSGIAAVENGHKAICIEKSMEYCKLGLRMYAQRSIKS
jgi:DNA modification methylase